MSNIIADFRTIALVGCYNSVTSAADDGLSVGCEGVGTMNITISTTAFNAGNGAVLVFNVKDGIITNTSTNTPQPLFECAIAPIPDVNFFI